MPNLQFGISISQADPLRLEPYIPAPMTITWRPWAVMVKCNLEPMQCLQVCKHSKVGSRRGLFDTTCIAALQSLVAHPTSKQTPHLFGDLKPVAGSRRRSGSGGATESWLCVFLQVEHEPDSRKLR
jgi:hypothetical protein